MKPLMNVTPIGAWDYRRMRRGTYMKDDNSAREASLWVWEQRKKKLSFL
jgi:hypothetical protein